MYIDDLINTFKEIAEKDIPELNTESFIELLVDEIKKNKYDIQDQTFIETALSDDKESFVDSFSDLFDNMIKEVENRKEYLSSEDGITEVKNIFIKNVDYTVDFFYNAIISKQFSDT